MNSRFAIIMAVLVVGLIGLLVVTSNNNGENGEATTPSNNVYGEGESGVTLIEYGDFQCPACAAYYPIVKQIKADFGEEIVFQYKHFPLIEIHPNAMVAHRASEAAAKQDKFWDMHDILFERQQEWADSNDAQQIIDGYANEIGLDFDQYKEDAASSAVLGVINADRETGNELGITGTPGFVLNGEVIDELPREYEDTKAFIEQAIEEAEAKDEEETQ